MTEIRKKQKRKKVISFIRLLLFLGMILTCGQAYGKAGGLYLVGLGPGDPDLATVKAVKLLQGADVIYTFDGDICDRFETYLKDKEVRKLTSNLFTRYNIRKNRNNAKDAGETKSTRIDEELNTLYSQVRKEVSAGKLVVFIDNGDPLIYGPWVWMLQEFEDINPIVVPGISSFNSGLAALRRDGTWAPETHSVILTTDRPDSRDNLEVLSTHQCSMVIFTHRTVFKDIIKRLKTGYKPQTPVAIVIYAGFEKKEKIIKGTLDTIESIINPENLPFEHIIYVGDFLTYDYHKKGRE
jgi:precorrin-4/cobalt-precorrin-4 C11-methyltransferase